MWVYAFWPLIFLAICWGVWLYDTQIDALPKLGVHPRDPEGLLGILTSPFFHSTRTIDGLADYTHIVNNSVPFFLLGTALFYHFKDDSYKIFIWLFIGSGVWLWSFGRPANHFGASGIVYSLFGFLTTSGFLRNNKHLKALSLLTIFVYGSMIWGIFPMDPKVSWEGHLTGLLMGVVLAFYFKKAGPRNTVTPISDENSRNEFLYGEDYWKTEEQKIADNKDYTFTPNQDQQKIIYVYLEKKKDKDAE